MEWLVMLLLVIIAIYLLIGLIIISIALYQVERPTTKKKTVGMLLRVFSAIALWPVMIVLVFLLARRVAHDLSPHIL